MSGRIFVIGASMQGVEALRHLVERLPSNFPAPILVTQHLGRGSAGYLPRILSRAGPLPAVHPVEPEQLEPSRIYIAPPDRHMLVRPGYIQLSDGPRENYVRPAIDPLFRSAANAYGPAVVGIVLTGELDDGAAGLLAIKDRGGITCVQDPREAYAPSMPQAALQKVAVDYCCTLDKLSEIMIELAKDDPPASGASKKEGLLEIECRVAEGNFSPEDWSAFQEYCRPTNFNCPDCHCPLSEINDSRMLRFRCRAGHAFSVSSLFAAQMEARENQLFALAGMFAEEAALAQRILELHASAARGASADCVADTLQRIEAAIVMLADLQRSLRD
ncbi:MAG: chemotaxis protein CheB [Cupriavidus sp.]|uniref:chemotaxis protein CheB n=1 Tax=Cupriavidus sp. TaxID=1873897 RepID=UPI0025C26BC7|nr:chemotaxis protein CheB [Cupriavidus sp.]MCA3194126.1 chemotaxis protein CheB [Cupriavidus sp.]MCA3199233.1 chemotaxis protein CheB [Cupriavidus sp.]MCA3233830.1 chemotaxis protein CheB [Cupriavidus sp.]